MNIAREVSKRSTCDRKMVGAVLVRDRMILSTGYNGSVRGMPHCSEAGHQMVDGHCRRVIHAELNALIQAARHGVAVAGSTCYVTVSPCWECFKALANAGIGRICFGEPYGDESVAKVAADIGIEICRVPLS